MRTSTRLLLLVAAALMLSAGAASPASAARTKRCAGLAHTPIGIVHVSNTTCDVGREIAKSFLSQSNRRPRDAQGRRWRCHLAYQGTDIDDSTRVLCSLGPRRIWLLVGYMYEFGSR